MYYLGDIITKIKSHLREVWACSECETEVEANDKFCHECGEDLREPVPKPEWKPSRGDLIYAWDTFEHMAVIRKFNKYVERGSFPYECNEGQQWEYAKPFPTWLNWETSQLKLTHAEKYVLLEPFKGV